MAKQRSNLRMATVDGNSGCPTFIVAGNDLVLVFAKHLGYKEILTGSRSWGPNLSFHLEAIQNQINEWEGEDAILYQLNQFDLNSFEGIINRK